MSWVQTLGIPGVFSAAIIALGCWLWKQAKSLKALKMGVQAMLRNMLMQLYNQCEEKGYASIASRENFENMYQQYHSLGKNGVMDDIRIKFLALPVHENETRQ